MTPNMQKQRMKAEPVLINANGDLLNIHTLKPKVVYQLMLS